MISRIASTAVRRAAPSLRAAATSSRAQVLAPVASFQPQPVLRSFSSASSPTVQDELNASDAFAKSCYMDMDFTIPDEATVYEAVQKFSAYDVGALVTTDADGNMSGVLSERDYIAKIALLGRTSKDTKVKEISTKSANLVVANPGDTVEICMNKMLAKGIRHLPLVDDGGKAIGLLSIKDLVKVLVAEKEKTIKVLSDFALGKGGHFGSE